jgi:hypothetical protein
MPTPDEQDLAEAAKATNFIRNPLLSTAGPLPASRIPYPYPASVKEAPRPVSL